MQPRVLDEALRDIDDEWLRVRALAPSTFPERQHPR
jgi:hypothetical protein